MQVKLFADNDHLNLQSELNAWLEKNAPDVLQWLFVADGAEFTYCVLVVHE
jgi:hypothetical protein